MLKRLTITPPVIGRISIGRMVEHNGKRLPQKDDQFTLTSQIQTEDGWIPHPMDKVLRKQADGKLRNIPVRMLFNDPELNLRASYSLFDRSTGRPICVSDGETCIRMTSTGVERAECNSPETCSFCQGQCKPYARFHVVVGDDDPLGTFVLRTTSYNTIRTLSARLSYFHAVSGGLLACLPLELKLRGKSTTQSYRRPIFYVDLTIRSGLSLSEALAHAKKTHEQRVSAGFNQQALDEAARQGFANGTFEELDEDVPAVAEEFYPPDQRNQSPNNSRHEDSLAGRLENRVNISTADSDTKEANTC